MKKILLATAIAALSISAAQAYQVELNGNATYNHTDVSGHRIETYGLGSLDQAFANSPGIQGTYYLNPVNDRSGPLAEAAFIQRASNVSASYNYATENEIDTKLTS